MASSAHAAAREPREEGLGKSILELAPLELECMNTLWPLGEGTVRDIQQHLAHSRPRAYTTIMTIMDRLAHKGVVTRQKLGRAYLYRPNLTAEEARSRAVGRLVEGFFDGSQQALAAHLSGVPAPARAAARERRIEPPSSTVRALKPRNRARRRAPELAGEEPSPPAPITSGPTRLDESLL